MELTENIILYIDDLLQDWAMIALRLGVDAHYKEEIPKEYANDSIYKEYYDGIYNGKTADQMRKVCLPKFILRELNKLNL